MEFNVRLERPFNLQYTLESGQVFRWERQGDWWLGVVPGGAVKLQQEGDWLRCVSSGESLGSAFVTSYFRLDDDLEGILAALTTDKTIAAAAQRFYGMRLVRQEKWECLASFTLATNANIPRIRKMVAAVCDRFGEPFQFGDLALHSFPTPGVLASQTAADLRGCGLGYRAAFLRHVASAVEEGMIDLSELSMLDYEDARARLVAELSGEKLLLGVGPKVADCLLLYACGKDEAFPVDVWIGKALARWYPRMFNPALRRKLVKDGKARLSGADYSMVSRVARGRFGENAGYAQQYLYALARSEGV